MAESLLTLMGAIGFGLILGSIVADIIGERAKRYVTSNDYEDFKA